MTKIHFALAASAALVATGSAAFAADEGTYVGLGGGVSIVDTSRVTVAVPPAPATFRSDARFETGWGLHGALGYKWAQGFRSELEIGHRHTGVKSLGPFGAFGTQDVLGLMGNLLFDFGVSEKFKTYAGGGVGLGWNKWKNVSSPGYTLPAYNDKDSALQWQGILGAAMPVANRLDGYAEYRYIGLVNNRFSGPNNSYIRNHDDGSHNIIFGLRYYFGGAQATAKAAAAPPPPPPPGSATAGGPAEILGLL